MTPDFSAEQAAGPQTCIVGSKQPINACHFMSSLLNWNQLLV